MDFFTAMEVSASGLSAQRARLNVASSNLANVSTTSTVNGTGPYKRKDVVLQAKRMGESIVGSKAGGGAHETFGVIVKKFQDDIKEPRKEYDPGHPDADADGNVSYPNINTVSEMVDMITSSRAYEAGVTAMGTAVSMAERALSIGR